MISHQPAPTPAEGGTPETSVANRYGAPKRPLGKRQRNIAIVAAIVLAVLAAGLLAFWNAEAVTSKDVAFDIRSDSLTTVTFDVDKRVQDTVECSLRVLNESYAVVGWTSEIFEAGQGSGREKIRSQAEVRTESIGVSGGVGSCWVR